MSHYCKKCGRMLSDAEFYISKNVQKYPPDGRLDTCKKCLTMLVDNWKPETYMWILEEIDVPYIKEEWDVLLQKYGQNPKKVSGLTIIGRYLAKMRMKQWAEYTWADSEKLAAQNLERKVVQMKAQGLTDEEIMEQISLDRAPPKPIRMVEPILNVTVPKPFDAQEFEQHVDKDEFEDQLNEEEKTMLRLKWGSNYRAEEWVRMEQLYEDMMRSYDIQGAGHRDTLIMICKTSLKANQLLDAGDKILCPRKIS